MPAKKSITAIFTLLVLFTATTLSFSRTAKTPDGKRWWSYVSILADDKMEGRNTGSEGHRKSAAYVAEQFKAAGLKPAGADGYFQAVNFISRQIVEDESSLELVRKGGSEKLVLGDDAAFSMRVDSAEMVEAPLVFVGYGLTIPEAKHNDLAGLDLKGKVVVYLSGAPTSIAGPLAAHYQSGSERAKALKKAGVVGAITLINPKNMDIPWSRATLARLQPQMSLADKNLESSGGMRVGVTINPDSAEKLFAGSGHTFDEILALHAANQPLPKFELPAAMRAKIKVKRENVVSQNIAGILPGSDPNLKDEYVVLSAHVDHLGIGGAVNGDSIYNGAMDNASGTAMLMELAATMNERQVKLRRSVLFVAVTGEEKGLLGSTYFAAHPTVPKDRIVADINMDMFLPIVPLKLLTVYGLAESDLGDEIKKVGTNMGLEIQADPEPQRNVFIRSDQYSFIRQGVPALAMKVGFKPGTPEEKIYHDWLTQRYHAPSDDLQQPVELSAAGGFEEVLFELIGAIADNPERPHWKSDSFFRRFAK